MISGARYHLVTTCRLRFRWWVGVFTGFHLRVLNPQQLINRVFVPRILLNISSWLGFSRSCSLFRLSNASIISYFSKSLESSSKSRSLYMFSSFGDYYYYYYYYYYRVESFFSSSLSITLSNFISSSCSCSSTSSYCWTTLDNPKSHSLILQFSSIRILPGFISRWKTPTVSRYFIARRRL